MAVEFSPRVAQETGGFGFQVPIFRMNQGINAATANPQARQSMTPADFAMEDFRVSPEDYQASLDAEARDGLDQGLLELNDLVSKAAMAGIDATKIDMSNPASIAVNQMFRKKFQDVKNLSKDIRTGVAQQKIELDREAKRRSDETYAWNQSQQEYQMKVVRPRAEQAYQREQIMNAREDLKFAEGQVEEKFKKLISPFFTQAQSLLALHLNQVDPKNDAKIAEARKFVNNQLAQIFENGKDLTPEVRERLAGLKNSLDNIILLRPSRDGSSKPWYIPDLTYAQQGLFTKRPILQYEGAKQSVAVGFAIVDGKVNVQVKRPNSATGSLTFAQANQEDPLGYTDATVTLDPTTDVGMKTINSLIQSGYSDDDEGKAAKSYLFSRIKGLHTQASGNPNDVRSNMLKGAIVNPSAVYQGASDVPPYILEQQRKR